MNLLERKGAMQFLDSSNFVMVLAQDPMNCDKARDHFHLSDAQVSRIAHAEPGCGLIGVDNTFVPFTVDLSETNPIHSYIYSD